MISSVKRNTIDIHCRIEILQSATFVLHKHSIRTLPFNLFLAYELWRLQGYYLPQWCAVGSSKVADCKFISQWTFIVFHFTDLFFIYFIILLFDCIKSINTITARYPSRFKLIRILANLTLFISSTVDLNYVIFLG